MEYLLVQTLRVASLESLERSESTERDDLKRVAHYLHIPWVDLRLLMQASR